jgi:hypothetical protein
MIEGKITITEWCKIATERVATISELMLH